MFSCEFYEIFRSIFFCRTPRVAASKFSFYIPNLNNFHFSPSIRFWRGKIYHVYQPLLLLESSTVKMDAYKWLLRIGNLKSIIYVVRYAIWYHLYNLKNVKPATLLKLALFHGSFSRFLNCTNGTESRNASHLKYL